MYLRKIVISIIILFIASESFAQLSCSTLGQNPSTAFPVCGTSVFSQTTVPVCGGLSVLGPCATNGGTDKNPFWYQFTCFQSGTLGFLITPNNIGDDYDWQLFDITNHNPSEVYTNSSLFVACDWSGITGLTGASANGTSSVECGTVTNGPYINPFSIMPSLIQGHTYLLLISHFTDAGQSGYALSFGGGSAIITDSTPPHLQSATVSCDNMQIRIKLNKKMKCSSLDADGSGFSISPANVSIVSATSSSCSNGFDMDSLILTLNGQIPSGNYTVTAINGRDGNTLADNCDNTIAPGESIPLFVQQQQPTAMDSLTAVGCSPTSLQLVFKKPILCSSIAPDGSDFIVTGTSAITVTGAAGVCSSGTTNIINVQLAAPIQQQGNYQIKLKIGSDGNTLFNECQQATPAGSSLSFITKDTVSANFTYTTQFSCQNDLVSYMHDGRNGVNSWQWDFGNGNTSRLQNPSFNYSSFGTKNTTLIVSNGVCSDTASSSILLNNEIKAAFEGTNLVCPGDIATFKDKSIGNIISWQWNFGNGNSSSLQTPPDQTYTITGKVTDLPVKLIVQNDNGCSDSAIQIIRVVDNCYIAVPSAFTPNNDGLNDNLYPLNAYKATNLIFRVYNRFGQLMFETKDWTNKWNGTFKGQPADAGAYVWMLQYIDSETGEKHFAKGTSILIR